MGSQQKGKIIKNGWITASVINGVFDVYPETGRIIWKIRLSGRQTVGDDAGTINKGGYVAITVDHKHIYGHQVVWMYAYGYLPERIDHINGNRSDNRLSNLREATHWQNLCNRPRQKNNTSGVRGVSRHQNGWAIDIRGGGKRLRSTRANYDEAVALAIEYAKELHGKFYNDT